MDDAKVDIWTQVYKTLPLDEAIILDLYFSHGETQTVIAERYGCSQKHISKTIQKACDSLRENKLFQKIWAELADEKPDDNT